MKDYEYNLNSWRKTKGHNILFITGLSGSGKSTLAREYANKYNAKLISLDWIENKQFGKNNASRDGKELIKYLEEKYPYYKSSMKNIDSKEYGKRIYRVLLGSIDYLYTKDELVIVEGVQIFDAHYQKDYDFKGKPMVIKNTPMLQSMYRGWKRDGKRNEGNFKENIDTLFNLLGSYRENNRQVNSVKRDMQTLMEFFYL